MTEDRICPKANECPLEGCGHGKPHPYSPCCDPVVVGECGACIQIPEMWLDKGLPEGK